MLKMFDSKWRSQNVKILAKRFEIFCCCRESWEVEKIGENNSLNYLDVFHLGKNNDYETVLNTFKQTLIVFLKTQFEERKVRKHFQRKVGKQNIWHISGSSKK